MSNAERLVALEVIKQEVEACAECPLALGRTNIVFGEGNPEASVVFLGEAPGQTEDETGRPFVGRAGKLLDNMIQSMNLKREDVFILNICKCRPPNNRKPTPTEMEKCGHFLVRQLEIIKPKVIIALGNTALGGLTGKDGGITKRCGVWESSENFPGIKIMPCYHPSALLRNPNWKEPAWRALQEVVKELGL
jgi:DNA polymerase